MIAESGAVYVFHSASYGGAEGSYKIGKSGNMTGRNKGLRTGTPDIVFVAGVQVSDSRVTERQLHRYFADACVGGEWFDASNAKLVEWVTHFARHRGTANHHKGVAGTFAVDDLWPWYDPKNSALEDETGQGLFDIGHMPPRLVEAPKANGYAPASNTTGDWMTAPEIIELTRELYDGTIDLDPMSSAEANKRIGATMIHTPANDGLVFPWYGKVFLNPPWGDAHASSIKERCIAKAANEFKAGRIAECVIVLNANSTTTKWFKPLFEYPMCFPDHRIAHVKPEGVGDAAPNSGTLIVYLGERVWRFAEVFSQLGAIQCKFVPQQQKRGVA